MPARMSRLKGVSDLTHRSEECPARPSHSEELRSTSFLPGTNSMTINSAFSWAIMSLDGDDWWDGSKGKIAALGAS